MFYHVVVFAINASPYDSYFAQVDQFGRADGLDYARATQRQG
jgi:hypothetical protein